ncbi:MAG: tetratricopeptide repeat protein [Acidobacteriia bacterium]|nr:tetratricopeptide repeat protein [Terriglobia bacterium]
MIWLRGWILAAGVVLAQGAPLERHEGINLPVGGSTDAIDSAREAVRESTAAFGADHPRTAFMLRNLALAFEQGGYHNYAESYAQRSLAILEAAFSPEDVSLVPALNVLTEAYASQGRFTEGRAIAMRAVAIGPGAGAHYATALHNLAATFQGEGRFKEAAEFYRRALSQKEALLPPGHPYIQLTRAALEKVERAGRLSAHR